MKIEENKQFKFASVWLTKNEQNNPQIRKEIDRLIEIYKRKKYKFIIYESGRGDLLELTKGLLGHNKKICQSASKVT